MAENGFAIRISAVAGLSTSACWSCRRRQPATTSSGSRPAAAATSATAGTRPSSTTFAYVRLRSSRSPASTRDSSEVVLRCRLAYVHESHSVIALLNHRQIHQWHGALLGSVEPQLMTPLTVRNVELGGHMF